MKITTIGFFLTVTFFPQAVVQSDVTTSPFPETSLESSVFRKHANNDDQCYGSRNFDLYMDEPRDGLMGLTESETHKRRGGNKVSQTMCQHLDFFPPDSSSSQLEHWLSHNVRYGASFWMKRQ